MSRVVRPPLVVEIGERVQLTRRHPCGSDAWTVYRVGADIGLECTGCGRRVMLERAALERRLRARLERLSSDTSDRGAP